MKEQGNAEEGGNKKWVGGVSREKKGDQGGILRNKWVEGAQQVGPGPRGRPKGVGSRGESVGERGQELGMRRVGTGWREIHQPERRRGGQGHTGRAPKDQGSLLGGDVIGGALEASRMKRTRLKAMERVSEMRVALAELSRPKKGERLR